MPVDAAGGRYRERPIEPGRTALLSIDMQNMECGVHLRHRAHEVGTPEHAKAWFFRRIDDVVIPAQARLLAAARAAGVEVMFTTIESLTRDGRDRSLDHKISRIHAPRGSWEGRVIDEVGPAGDEIVIPKTASGVFNSTNIDYVLCNLGVRSLVLFGVLTDQCVESTIRDAADRGYLVTVVEDACATYTEARHVHSIRSMDGAYARVRSADQLIAEIRAVCGPEDRAAG
ncbi:MAG: cysteine hydrolase [Rhodospirillaceae bacterium]|nr:cysteine hydrolase [Rhodospirillaceae bacterium]